MEIKILFKTEFKTNINSKLVKFLGIIMILRKAMNMKDIKEKIEVILSNLNK